MSAKPYLSVVGGPSVSFPALQQPAEVLGPNRRPNHVLTAKWITEQLGIELRGDRQRGGQLVAHDGRAWLPCKGQIDTLVKICAGTDNTVQFRREVDAFMKLDAPAFEHGDGEWISWQNCDVNSATGEITEHDPEHRTTYVVNAKFDDHKMTFIPYVAVMTVGGTLTYVNGEPFPDTAFSMSNEGWDFGMVPSKGIRTRLFPNSVM